MDFMRPRKENTIIFRSGARERLARQGKLKRIISNIPVWTRMGILRDRARWEGEVKVLLSDLWNQIKSFASINIP